MLEARAFRGKTERKRGRCLLPGAVLQGAVLALAALVVLLAGCANKLPEPSRDVYEASLDRWIGLPSDDLKREWGLPERTDTLNNGNILIEFRGLRNLGVGKSECVTIFEVNKSGFIIAHRSFGEACRARPAP